MLGGIHAPPNVNRRAPLAVSGGALVQVEKASVYNAFGVNRQLFKGTVLRVPVRFKGEAVEPNINWLWDIVNAARRANAAVYTAMGGKPVHSVA